MDGVSFSLDGPVLEGTWQNMQTGDVFTVRDSFFQDGQLMVQATDGRMFTYDVIQNYVKVDKPIDIKSNKKDTKQLPAEIVNEIEDVTSDILPGDLELIRGNKISQPVTVFTASVTEDEDMRFIKKVLDRSKKEPDISVSIKWSRYPSEQMNALVNVLGFDTDKIVDYYIGKIDVNSLREVLKNEIKNFIDKSMNGSKDKTEKAVKK